MKALSVVAGIVLTVVLYLGLIYLAYLYHNGSSQSGQWGEGLWFGFVVVIPVLIFPGGFLTGVLIQPSLEKSWISFAFYSPGIFFVGLLICLAFLTGSDSSMQDLMVCGGICLIWLFASYLGVALGYTLRAWISARLSRKF